jgi:hypothetical protein
MEVVYSSETSGSEQNIKPGSLEDRLWNRKIPAVSIASTVAEWAFWWVGEKPSRIGKRFRDLSLCNLFSRRVPCQSLSEDKRTKSNARFNSLTELDMKFALFGMRYLAFVVPYFTVVSVCKLRNINVTWCWLQTGFGLVTEFIGPLHL